VLFSSAISSITPAQRPVSNHRMLRQALLVCGIVSSLLYVAMNVLTAKSWRNRVA
jgi:hypothetical protein